MRRPSTTPAPAALTARSTVDRSGAWHYTLRQHASGDAEPGRRPARTDTFTVEVADQYGATDSRTVAIDVIGTNDAPIMQAGAGVARRSPRIKRRVAATGIAQFTDVDLGRQP